MNLFTAIRRGVTAPVAAVRQTHRLLCMRARAADVLDLAEDAEADPRLYRDVAWQRRLLTAVVRFVAVLPLPLESQTVIQSLLTNWKTTVVGLALGFGSFFIDALQNGASLKGAAMGAGMALLGMLAKDANVTGGTKPATPEAEARTE